MEHNHRRFIEEAARKIIEESVLFVIGSGLSVNWNMPSAGDLAAWLRERYEKHKRDCGISEPDADLLHVLEHQYKYETPHNDEASHIDEAPLDLIADALAVNKCWFLRDLFCAPDDPPRLQHGRLCHPPDGGTNFFQSASYLSDGDPVAAGRIGLPHIVLGRLAREGLIQEILTTNYDNLIEAGCIAVGMREWTNDDNESPHHDAAPDALPWRQAFRVVRSRPEFTQLVPRHNVFHVYKIHGCNAELVQRLGKDKSHRPNQGRAAPPTAPADGKREDCSSCTPTNANASCDLIPKDFTFVITRRELLDWRHDHWARDLFQDRARSHHLTLVGFGGEDAVIHGSLQSVYAEAVAGNASAQTKERKHESRQTNFRLQAVAREPNIHLQQLLRSGMETDDKPAGPPPPEQFYELGRANPKRSVESLFCNLYVESMQRLFRRKLHIGGTAWLERIVIRQNQRATEPLKVSDLHKQLQSGLESGFLPQHVWFYTLPKLVLLSWLLNEPLQATAGEAYLSRLRRPHFYIPMGVNENLFYPLFAFVVALQRLAGESRQDSYLTMDPVIWHHEGWIEIALHRWRGAKKLVRSGALRRLLMLPIVAPSDVQTVRQPHLPRQVVQPPARVARWPGTLTVVLHLREDGAPGPVRSPRGAVRHALGNPRNRHFAIPYEQVLDARQFREVMHQFVDSLADQPRPVGVLV